MLERGGTPRKRAVATCSNYQQKGHRKDKCPFTCNVQRCHARRRLRRWRWLARRRRCG